MAALSVLSSYKNLFLLLYNAERIKDLALLWNKNNFNAYLVNETVKGTDMRIRVGGKNLGGCSATVHLAFATVKRIYTVWIFIFINNSFLLYFTLIDKECQRGTDECAGGLNQRVEQKLDDRNLTESEKHKRYGRINVST